MYNVVCYYYPSMSGVTLQHFTPSPHHTAIMQSGQRGACLLWPIAASIGCCDRCFYQVASDACFRAFAPVLKLHKKVFAAAMNINFN